ncbi:MAG TPA: TolC family protein, partial [Opitutaceae bacterium]|nr:TolC family protein [Opitutaceae bacterium]
LTSREASYEDAATNVWNRDGYDWQVDLTFRMPWRFREEKARYRIAQGNIHREEVRYRQLDQALMAQVRTAVRAVQTNKESVSISGLATELSAKQYDLERERLKAGLTTSRRVLEAQDDLESARVNELQAKVSLRIAQAELERLEGTSLSRFKINIDQIR